MPEQITLEELYKIIGEQQVKIVLREQLIIKLNQENKELKEKLGVKEGTPKP